ncbi:MAG TPA: flagellar filament capping protein FliD [Methyloradius sp.]
MTSPVTSSGSASGLDVNSIVSALVNADKGTLNNLTAQQTAYNSKLSAIGTLKSALATYQTAMASLTSASKFNAQIVTAADTSVFTATASGTASVSNYAVTVSQLAQPQKLALAGFTNTTDVVGTGTLNISFGSYDSGTNTFTSNTSKPGVSITIDSSNNTLAGVRDAINAANAGVTATIVNDGSASGNRLVITSKDSGLQNTIKISVADSSDASNTDASGLSQLAYDPTVTSGAGKNLTEMQVAKNALLNIDGIDVSKSSNTITDAIDGVTLNLLKTSSGVPVNLSVSNDSATVQASVTAFVNAYNALDKTIRSLTSYDATTQVAGLLLGDSTVNNIANQLKASVTKSLGTDTLSSLSQIGVAFQRDGSLAVDSTKLQSAITNNFGSISALFTAAGKATDQLVTYTSSTDKTQAGNYAVTVSQLATKGSLQGSSTPNQTITQGVNDQLNLTVNGVSYNVTLTAGIYASTQDLINELQTRLTQAGAAAQVGSSGGILSITSNNYGSGSSVAITGGSGATDLFGGSPTATSGLDVAGTINGVAAIGAGQTLTGAFGDASQGLKINIADGALGARGTINFTLGFASQLNTFTTNLLSSSGAISTKTDGINESISRLSDQMDAENTRLTKLEASYRAQYTALDTLISSMNATSSYLTQQIAQFTANSSK